MADLVPANEATELGILLLCKSKVGQISYTILEEKRGTHRPEPDTSHCWSQLEFSVK